LKAGKSGGLVEIVASACKEFQVAGYLANRRLKRYGARVIALGQKPKGR
jgi:hypothetical protein